MTDGVVVAARVSVSAVMMHAWIASVALLATASIVVANATPDHNHDNADFTRQWVVHVRGGRSVADQVALDHGFDNLGEIFEEYYHFSHPRIVRRSATPHHERRVLLAVDTRVTWAQQQRAKRRTKRDYRTDYTDPRWPNMWYLNRGHGLDMNVLPAWQEGVTGKGAVVTILDDGLEKDHPDLIQNYDPLASYDVNNQDSDPSPRYDMIDSNRHGTRCAGEVAATSNNSICSLGVAHGAQVGGVRMLDGDVTDAVEARSLSLNPQHIDIYSASWGPDDDGKTVDGPGELATRAFIEGVTKGRKGKGSIFVWASGNGGRDHDNCNCDGYTNSIYSLSISSATEYGRVPWYSEACSSTLATTYSSGEVGERQVITTDLHHACTSSHTGTSASAPLAAGICALALEANPSLTWRDMQHIVVRTARPQRLAAHDWQTNGVGRNVSHSFGYGLMDAHAMVQLARKWITVPQQHSYEIKAPQVDKKIPSRSVVVLSLNVSDAGEVKILEHVQAKLTISAQKRGDLNIQLISPMGTRVTLLAHRIHDSSHSGFTHWPFMSVHSWGESPLGIWTLEVHNDGRFLGRATLQSWSLVLYGLNHTNPNDIDPNAKTTNKLKLPAANNNNSNSSSNNNNNNNNSAGKERKKAKKQKTKAKAKGNKQGATASPTTKDKGRNRKPLLLPFYYAVNTSGGKFTKFPKNYSITYPIMIPEREFEKLGTRGGGGGEDHRRKVQKPKEKSRDLNSNRNSEPRVTPLSVTATAIMSSTRTIADVHAWDLVLYGTTTAPAVDRSRNEDSSHLHSSFTTEDINENVIDPEDDLKSLQPEIRKDLPEEEYAQHAMNGCKQSRGSVCIACENGLYLFDNACLEKCPDGFRAVKYTEYNYDPASVPAIFVCEPCHYSCLACNSENDNACTACFPDAFLYARSANETYCYPKTVQTAVIEEVWYFRLFIGLVVVLALAAILSMGWCLRNSRKAKGRRRSSKMASLMNIRDMEDKVRTAVYSDSE